MAAEAVERFPEQSGGYVRRAEVAMLRGEWEGASERWLELRRVFPDHSSGYVRGAEALTRAGRLDEADRVAAEAVERFPDQSGGYVRRAEVAMLRGEWEGASERWGEMRRSLVSRPLRRGMCVVPKR